MILPDKLLPSNDFCGNDELNYETIDSVKLLKMLPICRCYTTLANLLDIVGVYSDYFYCLDL